jgi:hypothetical protein
MSDSYYKGEAREEETRQQYANRKIRELVLREPLTWDETLQAFRTFGQQYDCAQKASEAA